MDKKITISANDVFIDLLNKLTIKTSLKKSTIIRLAVREWSKKYIEEQ